MKRIFWLGLIFATFISCNKDVPIGLHFRMKIDGETKDIEACGSSTYDAEILKDTAIFINVACGSSGGFFLKGRITDGTYSLNANNRAYYSSYTSSGYTNFKTTNSLTGSLSISIVTYKNLPALKGSFSYTAIDTVSGKVINVTDGTFYYASCNFSLKGLKKIRLDAI